MRTPLVAPCAVVLMFGILPAQDSDYSKLKDEAERLFAEGSHAQARDLYKQAGALKLPATDARWVSFRLADAEWRSEASTQKADPTKLEEAHAALENLVRDAKRAEDRDRVWAEVKESIGDFHWTRRNSRNWGGAWPHYEAALEWWAGSSEIPLARARYLEIVRTAANPPGKETYYYYGYYGNNLPPHVLESSLRIASTDGDKALLHYLLAMTLRNQGGDPYELARVPEEFEAAMATGKSTDWHDDALYHHGEWMATRGRIEFLEDGSHREEPDFPKALELFRKLLGEYRKGETRYYDQAKSQVDNIMRPTLSVSVGELFLPGAEAQYQVSWRNVKRVDFSVYPIDLTRDVDLSGESNSAGNWLATVRLAGREKVLNWSKETGDKGDYKPGGMNERIAEKLPPGAYALEATAEKISARDIILVTDSALVLKTSGKQALLYAANAMDGSPLAGARVHLWERYHDGKRWRWRDAEKESDADGLAVFDLQDTSQSSEIFAGAVLKDRQTFAVGNAYGKNRREASWRIYAFTDRPAYRPGEKVEWKAVARRHDGAVYSTPARQMIEYQIDDPRGTKAAEGKLELSEFGSASSSLELTEAMPLGEYRVTFWNAGRKSGIGNATLFRLEEYKLPELKVAIRTPEENGKRKAFRLGERVEVAVSAEYYFGGPVADASVEIVVYQKPYYHWWQPVRDYPWYYDDITPYWGGWGGQGQVVKRETLRSDSSGKATLSIDTPRGQGQDLEYRIEARVVDQSRREVVGSASVRVTRQRYYVTLQPEHSIHKPQDSVKVLVKALDANREPVEAEGTVKVTREQWIEVWISPDGKEVRGESRPGTPREPGWKLKFRGWEHDEIAARTVKTNADGDAEIAFTAPKEGYYAVRWRSEDRGGPPVRTETYVWVGTKDSLDLGVRHGGLEIVVDKDTFQAGARAPVMLRAPVPGRPVLFTIEGEDLYSYRLVRMEGSVKLLELDVEEKHVPNVFLSAAMVSERELYIDTKQVIVPPTKQFLQVEVSAGAKELPPRAETTLNITARDHEGKPVSAEVAVSLVDEAVFYIQGEYAGDPRQFFYGEKRGHSIQTQSTFSQKRFAQLLRDGEKVAMDGGEENERLEEGDRSDANAFYGKMDVAKNGRRQRGMAQMKLAKKSEMQLGRAAGRAGLADLAAAAPMAEAAEEKAADDSGAAGGEDELAVQVRTDFRSTIVWAPDVKTDADGKATVTVKLPDSLTGWRAAARAATRESRFGTASTTFRTIQPLIARLQAPRFFVVGDTTVVSAVINNNTDHPMAVTPELEADGLMVKGYVSDGKLEGAKPAAITVDARGEARADWIVQVMASGTARLKVTVRGEGHGDAMEKTYPVAEHGIEKLLSKSGKIRGDEALIKLDLPPRKADSTSLVVQVAPSLAVTMLDALPYLAEYPYGCTEQTLSRFLPAVITARTLKGLGIDAATVMDRVFGGVEQATASKTHPGGKKDLSKLDEMAQAGVERLANFQHADGGWGWWKEGESDHFMTAYVLWGLTLAREADMDVKPDMLDRAAALLDKEIVEEESNPDMQAWMLHAIAVHHAAVRREKAGEFTTKAFDNLWKTRDGLNAYTRALFALCAHHFGLAEKAKTLVRNLENGVKRDEKPDTSVLLPGGESQPGVQGTAHWGEDGIYWRWSDGGVEATAFALRALLAIDPENKLVEPVTNWLLKNRRGAQWSNTRDTAIVVLAMSDYLKRSGELSPEIEYEVTVNGASAASRKVTAAEALGAPSRFAIDPKLLKETANEVRITRKGGKGPLYFAVEARFFSLEEPIAAAGSEIFVKRDYQKLTPRPTLLKGYVFEKFPLADQGAVRSGERVEVVLTIEAKNNYEYLIFEDLKPAGLEAVEVRSGQQLYAKELKSGAVDRKHGEKGASEAPVSRGEGAPIAPDAEGQDYTGRTRWVYQELRDRKVALFMDKLPEGVWEIRYELRAESPGRFHGLPVMAQAMYVPEIRANGAETRIEVEDLKPEIGQRLRRAMVEAR